MDRIEGSIEIGIAPREVFAFATMPTQMPLWMSSVLMTTCTVTVEVEAGTRFQQRWKLLGRVLETTYEVLEHAPPYAFAYQGIAGPVCCFVRSGCVPLIRGTRLTWRSDLDLRAVFHSQLPLAMCAAQRLLDVDLLTLKAVLERSRAVQKH